jgi:hypothetical protein
MIEKLELPVIYRDEELLLPMEMIPWGYTHRFKIIIAETIYYFEPDEEGNYRALIAEDGEHRGANTALLKVVGDTLAELMT